MSIITKKKFFPIFLPHKHAFVILPEMRDALVPCFKSISTAEASYNHAMDFLAESYSNANNYDTYRNDLIVFFCWAYSQGKDVIDITRTDMLAFIRFCNEPPIELQAKSARPVLLINKNDEDDLRINPDWSHLKTPIQINHTRVNRRQFRSSCQSFLLFLYTLMMLNILQSILRP